MAINVLLIDDDEDEYILFRDYLNEIEHNSYNITWIDNSFEGFEAIKQNQFDVYLIDYYLDAETGLSLIQKASKITTKPLILVTGRIDFAVDEEAKLSGAADYIVKGESSPQLIDRVIRYSIERSKNIEEIIGLNQSLEIRVNQRTIELNKVVKALEDKNKDLITAEKGIRQALEKEKELNELKSRFVSMASHEFRTPLATILSSASLLARYTLDSQQIQRDKHINRIKENVEHLNNVLIDFLSIGKLEEGVISYVPSYFDYTEFLERLLDDMSLSLKVNQFFSHEITGIPKAIKFDKNILKNVLINIISNAIKYSPENREITIKSHFSEDKFSIVVIDQGIGIAENEKEHIFERFYRANNVENIAGTGLGLNIVQKYLDLMKGSIHFESVLGEGSTFSILLPPNYK